MYQVIKIFAEKYEELFQKTMLVEIMNDIISHRRGDIFAEDRPEQGSSVGSKLN